MIGIGYIARASGSESSPGKCRHSAPPKPSSPKKTDAVPLIQPVPKSPGSESPNNFSKNASDIYAPPLAGRRAPRPKGSYRRDVRQTIEDCPDQKESLSRWQ